MHCQGEVRAASMVRQVARHRAHHSQDQLLIQNLQLCEISIWPQSQSLDTRRGRRSGRCPDQGNLEATTQRERSEVPVPGRDGMLWAQTSRLLECHDFPSTDSGSCMEGLAPW